MALNLPTLAEQQAKWATESHQKDGRTPSTERKRTKRQYDACRPIVRAAVFKRERGICRCCLRRPAETMHEIYFRGVGGEVSLENSIAVCGDGTRQCHGLLQRHEIQVVGDNAQGLLVFTPRSATAARWLSPETPGKTRRNWSRGRTR